MRGRHYLFYDGECGACHRAVRIVLRSGSRERFRFLPLDVFLNSSYRQALDSQGRPIVGDSLLYVRNGAALQRSRAVFAILSDMGWPWSLLTFLRIVPRFVTDLGYDLFAKYRRKVFGTEDPKRLCELAPPPVRKLLLGELPDGFTVFAPRPGVFLSAEWLNLVFFNYVVPQELLLKHLPRGCTLDLWEGQALCSLVAFDFQNALVLGQRVPGHEDFEEVNLRFYVRREAVENGERVVRRGVVFIKELVPKAAIAGIAQLLYNENYLSRPMAHDHRDEGAGRRYDFSWKVQSEVCGLSARLQGEPEPAPIGSMEEFITEHYWGYVKQRSGSTVEYEVEHPRWKVWRSGTFEAKGPLHLEYGAEFASYFKDPASACAAVGSPVRVFRGKKLRD